MGKIKIKETDYQIMCDIFDQMDLHSMVLETTLQDLQNQTLQELSYFIVFFLWCDSELEETSENKAVLKEMRRIIREHVEFI